VLEEQDGGNRKSMLDCAQTVEEWNCLWKLPEKRKEIVREHLEARIATMEPHARGRPRLHFIH
jgi:hypothetical protein